LATTPALVTRMSSLSYCPRICSAAFAMDSDLVTSISTKYASTPSVLNFAAAPSPSCGSRAPTSTVMPSVPSCRATSNPMPLFAPVIRAIFLCVSAPCDLPPAPDRLDGTNSSRIQNAPGGSLKVTCGDNRAMRSWTALDVWSAMRTFQTTNFGVAGKLSRTPF
jgi:hypothetical protein